MHESGETQVGLNTDCPDFSIGQMVKIEVGSLAGLTGRVMERFPAGRLRMEVNDGLFVDIQEFCLAKLKTHG